MATKKTKHLGLSNSRRRYNSWLTYSGNSINSFFNHKVDTEIDKAADIDMEMLYLLLKHYDISRADDDCWLELSYQLASEYISDFKYESAKRGRRKRTHDDELKLYEKVTTYRTQHPKINQLKACERVIHENTLPMKPVTLESLYKKVKKRLKEQK